MKKIHPAVAEHVMGENPVLRARIVELEEQIAALSQQAEPECDCQAECFDCAVAAVPLQQAEPAPAQDERQAFEAFQSQRPSHWRITNRAAWEAALKYAAESTSPAQTEQQLVAVPEDFQPLETIRWWISAYTNPENGPSYQGHGMMVQMLCEYEALRIMLSSRAQQSPPATPPNPLTCPARSA